MEEVTRGGKKEKSVVAAAKGAAARVELRNGPSGSGSEGGSEGGRKTGERVGQQAPKTEEV